MKINGWQGGSPHHPYYKPQNLSIMAVDLNKVAIQVAELHKAFTDVVNKACDVFSLIEDEADKARCENDFDVAINKAEMALDMAAKVVQDEAIIKLSNAE